MTRSRYTILRRSGVFDGWAPDDVIRMARFTRTQVLPPGTRLVEQATQPQELIFLTKG